MPVDVALTAGEQESGTMISPMESGRGVFGWPGMRQDVRFLQNQLIEQGAKRVTAAEDVIEERPTPIRAALVETEAVEAEQRNLLFNEGLTDREKKLYTLLSAEQAQPVDEQVATSVLNSSEVLATLFTPEMAGIVRPLPGKLFRSVWLVSSLPQRICCKEES